MRAVSSDDSKHLRRAWDKKIDYKKNKKLESLSFPSPLLIPLTECIT